MSTKIITTCDICGEEIHSDGIKICIKKEGESDLANKIFDVCEACSITETLYRINEFIKAIKEKEINDKFQI